VAEKAGKAAPAMAIAGVLVAAPQAHASVRIPARATTVVEQVHTEALITEALITRDKPAERTYTVRPGDTLSSIAQRFYGNAADWPSIYHVNESVVHNPDRIYAGEVLEIPSDPPSGAASFAASYTPRHAKATVLTSSAIPSGTLGCTGLETLWEDAGGAPSAAFMAAEIAMAECGGEQYALSPTDDYGYWQINAVNGSLATFNALGNAKSAVIISHDGTDWYPWTTYRTGAYEGRC